MKMYFTGTSGSQWEQLSTDLTNNSSVATKDNSDEDKEHKKLPFNGRYHEKKTIRDY